MRIYRNTFYITSSITLLSFIFLFYTNGVSELKLIYDLSLGIFGSGLLTAISSLVAYFVESRKCLESYYRLIELMTNKIGKYNATSSFTKSELTQIENNIILIKSIIGEDLRNLGDHYSQIALLLDFRHYFRNFLFAPYEYFTDLKHLSNQTVSFVSRLGDLKGNHIIAIRTSSKYLDSIIVKRSESTYTDEEGTSTTYSYSANALSSDLVIYLNSLLLFINKGFFYKLIKYKSFRFKNTFIDDNCFSTTSAENEKIFKEIISVANKQNSYEIDYKKLSHEKANEFLKAGYLSSFNSNNDNDITKIIITDALYYYFTLYKKYKFYNKSTF